MLMLYFSATGNGMYVSKQLSENVYSISKAIKEGKYTFSDDKIGVVFPTYDLGVPKYVEEFLEKVKLNSDYIFAVITYGKFSGSASAHLQKIAKKNNINFTYTNEVLMVDNYLPTYDMEEEIKAEPKKEIDKQIDKIKSDINSNLIYHKKNNFISKSISYTFRKFGVPKIEKKLGVYDTSFDKAFKIESSCVGCGICSKVCPVNNIQIKDKTPEFQNKCIGCLACTHNCPHNSIRLNGEKSRARFRNKHISLKDIINSNN